MTQSGRPQSSGNRAPTLLLLGVIVVAISLGLFAMAPAPPMGVSPGRMAPRVPTRPPDVATLLFLLGVGSTVWYCCVAALPIMLFGARRIDPERDGRAKSIVRAACGVLVLATGSAALDYYISYHGLDNRPGALDFLPVALRQTLLPFLALSGVVATVEVRRRSLNATIERERLRAQVAEQRLIALTGQLQPHFLFNTLQGISTLIHRSPNEADAMLAKLSDLLRDLLRHRDHVLIPLGEELTFARTFLELAKYRFGDRLEFDIADAGDSRQFRVPLFLLQPLIENALSHGIGGAARGGRISIAVARVDDQLQIDVSDDGAGIPSVVALVEGIGLTNTRERLEAIFGDRQSLTLQQREGGGTVVRVAIAETVKRPSLR